MTCWVTVYSSTASWLMSLPKPLPLIPPCGASEAIGRWSLTQVTPAYTRWLTRMARATSLVQIELASP